MHWSLLSGLMFSPGLGVLGFPSLALALLHLAPLHVLSPDRPTVPQLCGLHSAQGAGKQGSPLGHSRPPCFPASGTSWRALSQRVPVSGHFGVSPWREGSMGQQGQQQREAASELLGALAWATWGHSAHAPGRTHCHRRGGRRGSDRSLRRRRGQVPSPTCCSLTSVLSWLSDWDTPTGGGEGTSGPRLLSGQKASRLQGWFLCIMSSDLPPKPRKVGVSWWTPLSCIR